jgi:hypothetical protein
MIVERPNVSRLLESVRQLNPQEQLELLEQIAVLLRATLPPEPLHSILELEGLGAQVWRGIRAQDYLSQERAAWDG